MFIQNISKDDVIRGWHYDAGENSLLISIVDPDMEHPPSKYPFTSRLNLKFFDSEDELTTSIQLEQARQIKDALQTAKEKRQNVLVHCVAGICRSGAVVEYAIACLGFDDTETYRQPNLRVKQMLFNLEN